MNKKRELARREGYWYEGKGSLLPKPIARDKPWKGQARFLKSLDAVEKSAPSNSYKGWSTCRICGKKNGSIDFTHSGWLWPEGLAHYVKDHNVRPSLAFVEMILGEQLK